MAATVGRGDTITDAYGNTRTISKSASGNEIRQIVNNIERDKALLEAAKSGDFSSVTANVDKKDQRDVISEANRILKKVNALEGTKTGDYSGASTNAPMLYGTTQIMREL